VPAKSCSALAVRYTREIIQMSMAEIFGMRDGKIADRRAWVIPLQDNDFR